MSTTKCCHQCFNTTTVRCLGAETTVVRWAWQHREGNTPWVFDSLRTVSDVDGSYLVN
jgi:hypothetical protein